MTFDNSLRTFYRQIEFRVITERKVSSSSLSWFKIFQTVYEGKFWCLYTVNFCQKSSKLKSNVWCIKNRTKLSSVLLLRLVRFVMHQTLDRATARNFTVFKKGPLKIIFFGCLNNRNAFLLKLVINLGLVSFSKKEAKSM